MELLTTSPAPKLLEAGLETLYHQCNEWMDTIAFEQDELAFLADLMRKRNLGSAQGGKLEKDLVKLSDGGTADIKDAVARLRHMIDLTARRSLSNERACRNSFKEVAKKVETYMERVRALKRNIFQLAHTGSAAKGKMNETLRTIHERRAVRKFTSREVDPVLVEQIINAGRMAPSAMNRQGWKFHVLTNRERIKAFSVEIMKVAAKHFPLAHGLKPSTREDRIFHKAPVVVFISANRKDDWAGLDVGCCAQNMMLAAHALGLASCPIGLAKFASETPLHAALKVARTDEVKLAVVFGYADESPKMHERVTDNVIHLQ